MEQEGEVKLIGATKGGSVIVELNMADVRAVRKLCECLVGVSGGVEGQLIIEQGTATVKSLKARIEANAISAEVER